MSSCDYLLGMENRDGTNLRVGHLSLTEPQRIVDQGLDFPQAKISKKAINQGGKQDVVVVLANQQRDQVGIDRETADRFRDDPKVVTCEFRAEYLTTNDNAVDAGIDACDILCESTGEFSVILSAELTIVTCLGSCNETARNPVAPHGHRADLCVGIG